MSHAVAYDALLCITVLACSTVQTSPQTSENEVSSSDTPLNSIPAGDPFCQDPWWTENGLTAAEQQARLTVSSEDPTPNYVKFSRWNTRWAEFDKRHCDAKAQILWHKEHFDQVWGLLQQQERQRIQLRTYIDEEQAAITAFQNDLQQTTDAVRSNTIRARGFSDLQVGLIPFLESVRDAGIPMDQARKVAIQLSNSDSEYKVQQVLGSRGLIVTDDLQILIEGKKGEFYEGTPITRLGFDTFRVSGTQTYQSLTGTRQAFVVVPIDDFDAEAESLLTTARNLMHDGTLSFAQFSGDTLLECADLHARDPDAVIKKFAGAATFLSTLCAKQFSRPPLATCTLNRGMIYAYARPPGFEGFSQSDCAKAQGQWTEHPAH